MKTKTQAYETTKRLAAGLYHFTVGGRAFRLEEVGQGFGVSKKPLWHVGLVGEAAFEATDTLREAKEAARVAARVEDEREREGAEPGVWYVAALARYVLVQATGAEQARALGRGQLGREPLTVRPASAEEIELQRFDDEQAGR